MYAIDEKTLQKFYDISAFIGDIDRTLSPEIIASCEELDLNDGIFVHPSPLRSIGIWVDQEVWAYRFIELNVVDGTVFRLTEPQALAPVGHPLLAEQLARMLARCGREIISGVVDRIIVPSESVADVFDAHLAGAARLSFSARAWLLRNGYRAEW